MRSRILVSFALLLLAVGAAMAWPRAEESVETRSLQAPLNSINVNGTPTLQLVNRDGDVMGTWVGRLPADQEAEVLTQLKPGNVQN